MKQRTHRASPIAVEMAGVKLLPIYTSDVMRCIGHIADQRKDLPAEERGFTDTDTVTIAAFLVAVLWDDPTRGLDLEVPAGDVGDCLVEWDRISGACLRELQTLDARRLGVDAAKLIEAVLARIEELIKRPPQPATSGSDSISG